jgi:hypothetical protein
MKRKNKASAFQSSQFSNRRPGTWAKSTVLRVRSVASWVMAMQAIFRSMVPIRIRRFCERRDWYQAPSRSSSGGWLSRYSRPKLMASLKSGSLSNTPTVLSQSFFTDADRPRIAFIPATSCSSDFTRYSTVIMLERLAYRSQE